MRGHLRRRGRYWSIVLHTRDVNPKTGREDVRWISTHTEDKRAAERQLRRVLDEYEAGALPDPSKLTVAEYLRRWLTEDCELKGIRGTTKRQYRNLVEKHVIPRIGQVKLQRLQPQHLTSLYAALLECRKETRGPGTLSRRTINLIHSILHAALAAAPDDLLPANPADKAVVPKDKRKKASFLSLEQARAFLAAAAADIWYYALYVLAIETGLRIGELLGLQWRDINLEERTLRVRHTLEHRSGTAEERLQDPKSEAGQRPVALGDLSISALRAHRKAQLEARVKAGPLWEDNDLVFPNREGRPTNYSNWRSRHYAKVFERAGIPYVKPHELRHTSASMLLLSNVHPRVAQERLGHSDIRVTMNLYSHVSANLQRDAADKVGEMLSPGTPERRATGRRVGRRRKRNRG